MNGRDTPPAANVSRETILEGLGPAPTAVRALVGEREHLLQRYAERLATDAVVRGLIGPREVPRLWERHILNCLVLAPLLPDQARVADVGAGAGLPGLVLAIARPDVDVVLIEPLERRTAFLTEVVADLGLLNIGVHRGRAEHYRATSFDVVVCRAVAPLERLVTWCLPLLKPRGELLALKGSKAPVELAAAQGLLQASGAASWSVEQVGADYVNPPATLVRVVAGAAPKPR